MNDRNNNKLFFVFDIMIIYLCFAGVYLHYAGPSPIPFIAIPFKAALLMIYIAFAWFFISTNSTVLVVNAQSKIADILKSTFVAYSVMSASIIILVAVFGNFKDNNKFLLYPLLFAGIGSLTFRFTYLITIQHFVKNGYQQRPVLIIGNDEFAGKVIQHLSSSPELGYKIYGFLADEDYESLPKGLYIGGLDRISEIIRAGVIEEVFIALPMRMHKVIADIIEKCNYDGIRVRIIPELYNITNEKLTIDALGDIPVLSIRTEPLNLFRNRFIKRAFDIAFSAAVLICLSPFFILIAILIKMSSYGPVLFKQRRIGINNKEFFMYKFRSMVEQDTTASDTIWTKENDPRVTKLGNIIRKTNIDEIPQFWNVLIGNMSVVGPRPEREYFVEQFKDQIPNYKVRHLVKSGITGWAQVQGYRGDTSIEKRIEHDIYYLENWSIWLDLKIIWLTLFGKNTHKNAY